MVRENRPGSSRSCEGPKPWGRPKDRIYWPRYNRSTEAIMSEPIRQWFREKKVGSRASMAFAAVLLAQAQPASAPILRSFDRVLPLEQKAETSAGVSVGDVNEDGLPD